MCVHRCVRGVRRAHLEAVLALDGDVYGDKVWCKNLVHVTDFFPLSKVWSSEDE